MAELRTQVKLTYQDRDGNKALLTVYVKPSLSASERVSFLDTIVGLVAPLTSAVFLGAIFYTRIDIEDAPEAGEDADINASVVFYYSNGEILEAIYIPSPKSTLFESTGELAGIRVDATLPELSPWIPTFPDVVFGITTPEGTSFPSAYVVGGLTL